MGIKSYIKGKLIRVKKEKVLIPYLQGRLLEGRNAFVTGGSSGIGLAIAKSFISNGAKVTICGRDLNKLNEAKKKIQIDCKCEDDQIDILELNITKVPDMKQKLSSFLSGKEFDIFVNNAGINYGTPFPNTEEKDYDAILETNLKGMYFLSQEVVKYMIKNKIRGNVLNITSSSALRPGISPYIVSKWGERSLTVGMAKKFLPYGIVVNGLAPGSTLTPMLKNDEDGDLNLNYSPAKRYLAPEEIGNLATVLVSDMGKMIIGDTIYATGGAGVITYDDAVY